jgi:hypothetical protein
VTGTAYPHVTYALSVFFSTQSEMSWEEGAAAYRDALSNPTFKEDMERQVSAALGDSTFSWKRALFNDDYEVDDFEIEVEARDFGRELLWNEGFDGNRPAKP